MSDAHSSSSAHPAQRHLDPEALDELAGFPHDPAPGAGTPGRTAEPGERAHLHACPQCASLLDGVRQVRAVLAAAPVPPVPDDVAERLQQAVRTEARARRDQRGASVLPPAAGVPAIPRRSWPTRVLTAAAALLVVAGAGSLLAQDASGPHAGTAESAASAAEASAGDLGATGRDGASTGVTVLATGTDYRPQTLTDQTRALVQPGAAASATGLGGGAQAPGAPGGPAGAQDTARPESSPAPADEDAAATVTASASPLTLPGGLAGCLDALDVPAGATPVAVDLARYRGRDVAVVVTTTPYGEGHEVWVVSRSCGPGGTGLVGYSLVPR